MEWNGRGGEENRRGMQTELRDVTRDRTGGGCKHTARTRASQLAGVRKARASPAKKSRAVSMPCTEWSAIVNALETGCKLMGRAAESAKRRTRVSHESSQLGAASRASQSDGMV